MRCAENIVFQDSERFSTTRKVDESGAPIPGVVSSAEHLMRSARRLYPTTVMDWLRLLLRLLQTSSQATTTPKTRQLKAVAGFAAA